MRSRIRDSVLLIARQSTEATERLVVSIAVMNGAPPAAERGLWALPVGDRTQNSPSKPGHLSFSPHRQTIAWPVLKSLGLVQIIFKLFSTDSEASEPL
jgi:hypothetical protein